MDTGKISFDFAEACIRKFKTILNNRPKVSKCSYPSDYLDSSIYDEAKEHETKTRNLQKALSLYAKAAISGEKVNSCIKDFASVLHQCGLTHKALNFLEDMRPIYKGDKQKYEKLIKNLASQLRPTGKHCYKNILIDLIDIRLNSEEEMQDMFGNCSRVKEMACFEDLGFSFPSNKGRYVVLQFDSFSAAKKTLETFKEEEWFAINKFWMDSEFNIVAEAIDGKMDFENGLLINKGRIEKLFGKSVNEMNLIFPLPNFPSLPACEGLQLINEISLYLIQNKMPKLLIEEKENTF